MASGRKTINSEVIKTKKKYIKNFMINIWESYNKYTKVFKF